MEPGTIFFLASDLAATGSARHLARIAAGLRRFRAEVGVLGTADTPIAAALKAAGIPVHSLPIRTAIDWSGMRKLRQAVAAAKPAIVHAWGPAAVRATRLLATNRKDGINTPRLIASAASFPRGGVAGWLTTRLLRRFDRVVSQTRAEGDRYRRLGVLFERLTRIAPGIALPAALPDQAAFLQELNLPPKAGFIAVAGRLEPASGFKSAIWSFDLVKYEYPNLHLVIFGDGSEREALEEFGRSIMYDDFRIRFAGSRADLPELLALADTVWVTHDRGGVALALEAMAAGRPVLGWKTAEMLEIVDDEKTGDLVAPGDRAQLAVRTYPLLRDPTIQTMLGTAGRKRAAEHFHADRMIEQHARLYEEVAG